MSESTSESTSNEVWGAGWIMASLDDRHLLESFGIHLGPYDYEAGEFQRCSLSLDAFLKLEPHWGRFIWGLGTESSVERDERLQRQATACQV